MEAGMRESYGPAADRLAAYATGASAESLATLADQLLAIAALLGREPRLRRALTDPARGADDRAELARNVLGGKVEDELFRFAQVTDGAPQLAGALGDAGAPVGQRAALVGYLLDGKARGVTVALVRLALAGFGGRSFSASLARLVELTAEARDRTVAYVTSAIPLTEDEEARLGGALAQRYGRQVSVRVTVDPEILGGLSVQIGSDLYDGTVLRRLLEARTALTK